MPTNQEKSSGCLKTGAIVLLTVAVSVGITVWVLTQYIFPKQFDPVKLSEKEQSNLQTKLAAFNSWGQSSIAARAAEEETVNGNLQPEKYSEDDADRTIEFSERELNAMLANNTDLAQRLAIDLSDNLASAKLLIPLDPDFPIMGGKTLKLSAGLELAYANDRPIVILKGVSIMGIPVPNNWLGGYKNVDLVSEFGEAGFWKAFSDGVELVKVEEGQLVIRLKQ